MRARQFSIFVFVILSFCHGPFSFATSFAPRPYQAVIAEATNIVLGTVGHSHVDWGKGDQSRQIFTYYQFSVKEVLQQKGTNLKEGDFISIRQPGGEKDGVALSVPGAAYLPQGQELVLTLSSLSNEDDSYDVLNMAAGTYFVKRDGDSILLQNGLNAQEGESAHIHRHEDQLVSQENRKNLDLDYSTPISLNELRLMIKEVAKKQSSMGVGFSEKKMAKPSPLQTTEKSASNIHEKLSDNPPADVVPEHPEESSASWLWVILGILFFGFIGILYFVSNSLHKGDNLLP